MIAITYFAIACIGVSVALLSWFFRSSLIDDNEEIRRITAKKHKEAVWIANHGFVRFNKWNLILIAMIFVASVVLALLPNIPMVSRDITTLEAFKGGDADAVAQSNSGKNTVYWVAESSGANYGEAPLITPIDY